MTLLRESQTADLLPPRPCTQCGKPEHGSIACSVASEWPVKVQFCIAVCPCPYCAASLSVVYDFNHIVHLEKP